MNTQPILIIGKNGKTGERVNRRLKALGHPTRAVSRSTNPAFDWNNKDTWRPAMQGTQAAYVTFQPDLAIPSAEQTLQDFVQLAKELDLKHLVLLSGRGEEGAEKAEQVLQHSGITWNIIRASWFSQNFSEGFMIEGILQGTLRLPVADMVEPFVDVDDIAEVAVAALTQSTLHNQLFEVTGPRAMTFSQCVQEISTAVGYPVTHQEISIDTFIEELKQQDLPEQMLWLMRELFTVVLDGRNRQPMNGIQQALGRPATDFTEYVQKAVNTGAWTQQAPLVNT